jgi:hypothetical protein
VDPGRRDVGGLERLAVLRAAADLRVGQLDELAADRIALVAIVALRLVRREGDVEVDGLAVMVRRIALVLLVVDAANRYAELNGNLCSGM